MLPVQRCRVISTFGPPAVITGLHILDSLSIIASQIAHNAGLAPFQYIYQNSMREFLPPWRFEPASIQSRQVVLDHATTVRNIP